MRLSHLDRITAALGRRRAYWQDRLRPMRMLKAMSEYRLLDLDVACLATEDRPAVRRGKPSDLRA
ncbi:hypothetical protein [Marinivivus vitaminiproducens]|uniref:hypothetical protein n=1 Tax=Marinivivus vitaminiproducens TaxID=3035935 RepID=UPI00279EAD50|nr:hypothetical protein P4R82_13435 [Geminicoccaceae bacterium SCSIO 64248]